MTDPGFLDDRSFAQVVRWTPLVSIDIIIRDASRAVLLGYRTNEPAKNSYFVPGGVIRKNERLANAFQRILTRETGLVAAIETATLIGVFEHIYATNRFGDPGFSTHYVVAAYELSLESRPQIQLDAQHSAMRWMAEVEILSASDIHENTKAYFRL